MRWEGISYVCIYTDDITIFPDDSPSHIANRIRKAELKYIESEKKRGREILELMLSMLFLP